MNRRSFLLLSTAVVAAGGAWWYSQSGSTPSAGIGAVSAEEAAAIDTSTIPEMAMGSPDAKVTVIEYASFTCPHCQNFHATVFDKFKANYIDTGKVRFIYREVYFDRFGLWAAMLARCGGEMRYFGIADILYDTQSEWLASGEPVKIAENLRKIGRTAGMTDETVNACLNDAETAKALVAVYQKNATADDVTGTPTLFVNGAKYSNMDYEAFAKILDAELAKG